MKPASWFGASLLAGILVAGAALAVDVTDSMRGAPITATTL